MRGSRVAVVTTMREERDAILRRARDARPGRGDLVEGRIGGAEVALAAPAGGAKKAERAAAGLCDAFRPAALIGIGVAGALSPDLRVGDLLVSRRVRDREGDAPCPDERLSSRALACGGAAAAMLVTVERPLVAASEKAALALSVDSGGLAAADMESAAWARAASARGIPYVVLRCVSDRAEEELPDYLARCAGEDGEIRRAAVAVHALARPATIPALLRMRRRVKACSENLARFLEALLSSEI